MATLNVVANPSATNLIKRFSDPVSSGDYHADTQLGRRLADELVDEMGEQGFAGWLPHVVRDLVAHGEFTAVHTGFFQRVAEHAIE